MPGRLRVLVHGFSNGAWNMAVDEALLDHGRGFALRFYRWRRPTLSIGYAQPVARAGDAAAAHRLGVDVVRRPTGGRAVLHADEITYAITGPTAGPLGGSVTESYRLVAAGLQRGFRSLGVAVDLAPSGPAASPSTRGPCFGARTRHELSVAGRKLVGSAQRRRHGRLLQHGSILLGRPDRRLWGVLGEGSEDAVATSIGLDETIARPTSRGLVDALARGIAHELSLSPSRSSMTFRERRAASRARRRYADPGFTRRV